MKDHGIALQGDVGMAFCSVAIVEGLIRSLDPDFDVVMQAMPYFVRFRDSDLVEVDEKGWIID
jgi:hypothetical protein